MKKRRFSKALASVIIALSLLNTGCWDRFELTELGFVEALAIDEGENGSLRLTTQFLKPTMENSTATPYENIKTQAATISEAIRDIPLKLGRKAKWDHMQVLLVSEQIARKRNLYELFDFFRRGYEPRGTIHIIITRGNASNYLNKRNFIDETSGTHLQNILEKSFRFNAKVLPTTLFDFDKDSTSEVDVAMLPYITIDHSNNLTIAGMALLKNGRMKDFIPARDVKKLLMLADEYKSGSLEIPCPKENGKESFEIQSANTYIRPVIRGEQVIIRIVIKIDGAPFDLLCHSLQTPQEEQAYAKVVGETVKAKLIEMLNNLKRKKIDAIGIGNQIYYQNSQQWKKWKDNWDEIFSRSHDQVFVNIQIKNKGMSGPK